MSRHLSWSQLASGAGRFRGRIGRRGLLAMAGIFGVSGVVIVFLITRPPDAPLDSIVAVRASGCSLFARDALGSGVAVGEDLVATSAHTIAGADEVWVVQDGSVPGMRAEVVAFDDEQDVAIVRVPDATWTPVRIGTGSRGQSVVVAVADILEGPSARRGTITDRLRVTIEDIYLENIVERDAFEIAAPIEHGDSGGAVLSEEGALVAVIYAANRTLDDVGYAVDARAVASLLAEVTETTVDHGRCP